MEMGAYVICGASPSSSSPSTSKTFKWIGNEDQAWAFVSKIDTRFIVAAQQSTVALLQFLGFEPAFLRKRCEEGDSFRLLLFPLDSTKCGQIVRPTWDGLLALVEQESPTCGYKLGKHIPTFKAMSLEEHLELGQAVDALPAKELQQASTFEAYAVAGEESLRHARSFLRHALQCTKSFTGQGFTMILTEERGQVSIGRGGEVAMVRRQPVANIPGVRWITLNISEEQIEEVFGEKSKEEVHTESDKVPSLTSANVAETLGPLPSPPHSEEQIANDLLRTPSGLDAMPSGHFRVHHELRHADYREGEENVPIPSLSAIEGELRKFTHRAFNNTWQTRIFSCDNFYLRYRIKTSKTGEYSGTIDLRDVDRIELHESKKKKTHEFRLCYNTGDDPYRLSARTREDAERWVAALRERTMRRPPLPPSRPPPVVGEDEAGSEEEEEDVETYESEEDQDIDPQFENVSTFHSPPPSSPPPPPAESPRLRRNSLALGPNLLDAAMNGDLIECLEILDMRQGPLNYVDAQENITALHVACFKKREDIAAALLLRGANPDLVNVRGSTPLNLACQVGAHNIAEWLVSGAVDPEMMAQLKPPPLAGASPSRPADVNISDKQGVTPLMHAAMYGHRQIAALLLAAGADAGSKDISGRTAVEIAIESDESSLVDMLQGKHVNSSAAAPLLTRMSTAESLMGGGSLRGDTSSTEQQSLAAEKERVARYEELSDMKVKVSWPPTIPVDRQQKHSNESSNPSLSHVSTAALLMGEVPPMPSIPVPRKSKLFMLEGEADEADEEDDEEEDKRGRDDESSPTPSPILSAPVSRKSKLPAAVSVLVLEEEDEAGGVEDVPPPPPPLSPPSRPTPSIYTAGTRVLALYSHDELFYEATVVKKAAEGENCYIVVFDGYGAEEVSTDVRNIDASLSEFDVESDGEEAIIAHEEVLKRKDSVMKDLVETLSARKLVSGLGAEEEEEDSAMDEIPTSQRTRTLVNPVMDRPRLPHRRPVRRRKKGHLSSTF
jgi:hypothetical protein